MARRPIRPSDRPRKAKSHASSPGSQSPGAVPDSPRDVGVGPHRLDGRNPNRERTGQRAEFRSAPLDDKLVRVCGAPSVAELFNSAPERVERLYFDAGNKAGAQDYCTVLARRHKVYRQIGADELKRVSGTAMHGGIVALAHPRPVRDLDFTAAQSWASNGSPLLILDGIANPQNIGAIARTAAYFGIARMVLSDHPAQAGLSDASYRLAMGGLDRIDIYRAKALAETLARLSAFYHVVGTSGTKGTWLEKWPKPDKPIALVLTGEESPMSPQLRAACGSVIALRGRGQVKSLSITASAAILLHALFAGV